ncbi:diguanylate cyclase [Mycolicibacterium sp.]|uniref:diguanylate cyclase n=1 Tax=Mycolicibacterium sp. TaxID=2320850 RepID=UPI003D0A21B3
MHAHDDSPAGEGAYRRLLDRSLLPVCTHDGDVMTYANRAAAVMLTGSPDATVVGRPIADFIHPDSLAAVRERISRMRDGDVTRASEITVLGPDDTTRTVPVVAARDTRHGLPRYEVLFYDPLFGTAADDPPAARTAEAIINTDRDGIITGWNTDAHTLYGRAGPDVIGSPIDEIVGAAVPLDDLTAAGARRAATHVRADGGTVAVRVLVVRSVDGFVLSATADVVADRSGWRMQALLDLIHEGVVVMDSEGRVEYMNAAARRMFGSQARDLIGLHHSSGALDLPMFAPNGEQISTESHPIRWIQKTGLSLGGDVGIDRLDGERVWINGHGALIDPDDPVHSSVLFSFTDITAHHDARTRLLHDATHDALTGLPNRVHALNRAAAGLARTGPGRLAAVLFIDLDRLKTVNDRHGHPIGDDVLRIAAQRMRAAARADDVVARIGGDEFVVLLMGAVAPGEVDAIARRLHEVLADEVVVGSLRLRIGASIGITTIADCETRTLAEVLRDADAAMYRAKARGPANTAHFHPDPAGS